LTPISLETFIRREVTGAVLANVVLNPLLAWLANREMAFKALWAADGIVVDLALTSVILSLLVGLFTAGHLNAKLRAGEVATPGRAPRGPAWLSRLPRRGWLLGLIVGLAVAVAVVLVCGLLDSFGVSGLSAVSYLALKAAYGGCLAFVVARWALLRQAV
jgi:hypothetical protein